MYCKLDLRTAGLTNKHIRVRGIVYDRTGENPQPGAVIEILNPVKSSSLNCKNTKLTADKNGEYEFWTDCPERQAGKAPRINFIVSGQENSYNSELVITDFDAHISDKHWEKNRQLGDKLFPVKKDFANHSEVSFNLSV